MAVPYEGVPSIMPRVDTPADYQNIPADPAAFGTLRGQAIEKVGAATVKAGQFFGEVAADNASNDFQDFANKLLHGDPQKQSIGPDGKPAPDLGYVGLKGRAALDARPNVEAQLEEKLRTIREGLTTPDQQLRFDNFSRRYRTVVASQIGTHADTQANSWYNDVEKNSANLALQHISTSAVNPNLTEAQRGEEIAHGESDLINARIKTAQRLGAEPGDEVWRNTIATARADAFRVRLEAISVHEPKRALDLLEAHPDTAGLHYQQLAAQFRTRATHQDAIATVDQALVATRSSQARLASAPAVPVAGLPATYIAAIRNEEGYDTVPRWDVKQWTVGYGTRAAGPEERPSEQALELRFQQSVAQAARIVDGVNPNLDAGTRAALISLTHNTGDAWTHAALGAAVRAGDMPSAKERFLQYNHVAGEINPAVAERRAREVQWFGSDIPPAGATPSTGVTPETLEAGAMRRLMTSDKPWEVKQAGAAYLKQLTVDARIAADQQTRQRKEQSDAAVGDYLPMIAAKKFGGLNGEPTLVQRILADPRIEPSARHTWAQFAAHASGDAGQLVDFGPGWEAAKRAALSAPGTPGHIADPADIAARGLPGGDLTPAGVHDIVGAMQIAKKSPDEFGLQQTKMSLQGYAKSKLSFEQDTGPIKIRDPKGEQIFSGVFVPRFNKLYADWIGSGKSGYDFLTRETVDKIIAPLRPKSEMEADRLRATGEAAGEAGVPKGAVPAAPQGADATGWREIVGNPPSTATGKAWPYESWAKVINFLRANPTPENIKQFDEKFAGSGYKAEAIIAALAGKTPKRETTIEERATAAGFPPIPRQPSFTPPHEMLRNLSTPTPEQERAAAEGREGIR